MNTVKDRLIVVPESAIAYIEMTIANDGILRGAGIVSKTEIYQHWGCPVTTRVVDLAAIHRAKGTV